VVFCVVTVPVARFTSHTTHNPFMAGATAGGSVPFCSFVLDDWPAVVVSLNRPPTADAEITRFQQDFCGLLSLAVQGDVETGVEPTKLLLTMRLDGIVDASLDQQVRAASFIEEVKPLVLAGSLQATALVVSSERARDILHLILSLAPLTSKHAIFSTAEEAAAWLATV
jgi:hypothetical protein